MNDSVPGNGLHPNIARIAAAYDIILEQLARRELTVAQARAKVAQLEARDDQGVRWSIDPDTGQFVRRTAMGAEEYDTPPMIGYQTHDAFSYTQPDPHAGPFNGGPAVENPNARVELYTAPNEQLLAAPTSLAGATRNGPGMTAASQTPPLWDRVRQLPTIAQVGLLVTAVLVLALLLAGARGHDPAPVTPQAPNAPASHHPAPKAAHPKPAR